MNKVLNLNTGEEHHYTCSPKTAVIAAWRQSKGDFNTWDYEKFNDEVKETKHCFCLHDFAVLKESET